MGYARYDTLYIVYLYLLHMKRANVCCEANNTYLPPHQL